MFNFIIKDSKEGNVTMEYLRQVEEKYDIVFPDVLVDYYLNHNLAQMDEFIFDMGGFTFYTDFIIPLKNANVHVEEILERNKDNEYIPESFVPFMEDMEGDDFYWDKNSGKVYYLNRENVENPWPMCDSVDDFFRILEETYRKIGELKK